MEKLLKISLIISILGIFSLLLLSNSLSIKDETCSEITEKNLGELVHLEGTIEKGRSYNDFKILTLKDGECKIEVTCYCKESFSGRVEIIGRVEKYQDKLQIKADKINYALQ